VAAGLDRAAAAPVASRVGDDRVDKPQHAWGVRVRRLAQDVVAAETDSLVYLYTSLKAVQPFVYQPAAIFYGARTGATGSLSEFERILKAYHPRFLLYYPKPLAQDDFAALIASGQSKHPQWMHPVYRGADPRVVLYEFDRKRGP
jgi:hypothetical protein